ncbi:MFS general substrate transporter [Mycena olivaceomarginata]|nr:MFS general substrate transporter [Mycena olivaceomarginata]
MRTPLIPKGPAEAFEQGFCAVNDGHLEDLSMPPFVATLLGTIGSSLQSMQLSSWIGTALPAFALRIHPTIWCRLANILGRRHSTSMCFAGTLFGGGGTILCGLAQNIRGLYQGFANLLFGLGGAIGAPLGGSPFLIFGLLLLYLKIREPESVLAAANTGIFAKLKRIDYAGSATLVLTLLTFLLGMHFKSTLGYAWEDPRVWGLLTAAAVLACLFLLVELKFAAEPVMPITILKRVQLVAVNNFLLAVLSFSILYNTPLYFTAARLRTSANAGSHLITNSVFVAIGSLLAGLYMRRTGRYWTFQVISSLSILAANILLASWNPDTPEWGVGFGFASVMTTTLLALIASVPRDDIPLATGISYLFRTMGQVLGTLLARNLRARISDEDIVTKILDSTAYIHTLPADLQHQATTSWALALRTVFYCHIGIAVAIFLSVLPMEEFSLPDTVAAEPVKQTQTAPLERDAERACGYG